MGAPAAGTSFGYIVGGIFIFNLVVGTGSLALPSGWYAAGLVWGILMTLLIFFLAYICVTFVIETQSVATVMIEKRKKEELLESETMPINGVDPSLPDINTFEEDYSSVDKNQLEDSQSGYPYFEDEGGKTAFFLKQVEMGGMAETLLGKGGRLFFYLILLVYLYGDLAIYAVTVPQSVLETLTPNGIPFTDDFTLPPYVCYWCYLIIFSVIVLPFCLSNFSNSKYLQFFTIICRNLAFVLMILIALVTIFSKSGADPANVPISNLSGIPTLWGTIIYCFMCHHSIPGLISPLQKKRKVNLLMFLVYCGILVFYLLLSSTALFAYGDSNLSDDCKSVYPCQIDSLYTYNFLNSSRVVISYYLGLFPVFTLTSNYPLIAITLRNNMMKIFTFGENAPWAQGNNRRQYLFALIASLPSLLLAAVFTQVDVLVSLTGSYAGLFIEFVIPVTLVYFARKEMKEKYPGEPNPYKSPFQNIAWLIGILIVAGLSLIVVTLQNVVNIYDLISGWLDN